MGYRLSPSEKMMLEKYVSDTPYAQIDESADAANEKSLDLVSPFWGEGKFRDTGRKSSGVGEALDSYAGAPARVAIDRLQDGELKKALVDGFNQIGADPSKAPTGVDIASKVTDNPWLGAGLATAVDVGAQLPLPGGPGVAGKVKDIAPEAEAILKRIATPEQAVALKGAERAEYLKALDSVYGDRAKRASDMGFGDKTWYHGTSNDFDKFDQSHAGSSGREHGEAYFFSKHPDMANEFAEHSGFGRDESILDKKNALKDIEGELSDAEGDHRFNDWFRIKKEFDKAHQDYLMNSGVGEQILPVKLRSNKKTVPMIDTYGESLDADDINEALKNSHDGLIFKNMLDTPNPDNLVTSDVAVVKKPNQIRSTNAAFDPRFKDSDLLLAGRAGASGNTQGAALTENARKRLEEYLREK